MFTYLTIREKEELNKMIKSLEKANEICVEKREFYMMFTMVQAFRDIILTWPTNEFLEAYETLEDWTSENLGWR